EKIKTPLKLVLAGGSSYTDEYACSLRQHASDRIVFLDWLSGDELSEVLTNAALFVLPSDIEGLSLALLDAMGAGICVLTSDTPENKEAIADTGFTFNAGDGCDLQRMLTVLLSDSRLREAVGKTGQERVRQHFLWDGVVRELAQIYGTLVTPEKRPSVIPLTEEQHDTLRLLRPKAPIAR
ncbi:MAG: hypothetical protein DMG94_01970, partial [Acidobacteria bacterium]